jgi:pseudomonalisin/xanthomonalisin
MDFSLVTYTLTNGVPESGLPEVNYPCSAAYIVCVGGTSLFTNSDGSYAQELGWYAGGGGISTFEAAPSWQSCVVPSSAGGEGVGTGQQVIAWGAAGRPTAPQASAVAVTSR